MFVWKMIGALSALALLAACSSVSGFPERPASATADLQQLEDAYFGENFRARYDAQGVTEAQKRQARNEIVNGRMAAFDIVFNRFQQGLHQEGIGVNLSADAVVLGLGAAGSVVSGGTSQLLSAAAGGVTGLKGAIDRDVFFERTMPVLLQEMNAQRKTIEARIREGLNQSTTDYPLGRGLSDLEAYYFAGTIPGALVGIVESAGAKGARAEAMLVGELTSEAATEAVITGAQQNLAAVAELTDEQARRLALTLENMFPNEIAPFAEQLDPQGFRFREGDAARRFIRAVTPRLNRTRDGVEKLNRAIESVKQS